MIQAMEQGLETGVRMGARLLSYEQRGAMVGFEGAGAEWGDWLGGSGKNPG